MHAVQGKEIYLDNTHIQWHKGLKVKVGTQGVQRIFWGEGYQLLISQTLISVVQYIISKGEGDTQGCFCGRGTSPYPL